MPFIATDRSNGQVIESSYFDAIEFALQHMTARVYNVREYGAVGDGTTDDSTAVANALAAIPDNLTIAGSRGGTLYFPNGTYLIGSLTLKNRVAVIGDGPGSTFLDLKNSTNASMLKMYTNGSPSAGQYANACYLTVANLTLRGRKANQTGTSHAIEFVATTWDSDDENFDPSHTIHNVHAVDFLTDGFRVNSRLSTLIRCMALRCNGRSYHLGEDMKVIGCDAAYSGLQGFYVTGSSNQFSGCKSWWSGQVTAGSGYGFEFITGARGNILSSCEAQDNWASGFHLNQCQHTELSSCIADSNGAEVDGSAGYDLWGATDCVIAKCKAWDRTNARSFRQQYGAKVRNTSARNDIAIQSAGVHASYAHLTTDSLTALRGNIIVINGEDGAVQAPAFAASYTPDPRLGSEILMTLTNNITVNAPTSTTGNALCAGSRLTFIFIQDATGGRTITFNAAYKRTGTVTTTANTRTITSFVYDGADWNQVGFQTGIA